MRCENLFCKNELILFSPLLTEAEKDHLHNHVVINSVSFVDGKKYHSSPASYYNLVRATSDEICKENDLFIIEPKGRGKHYAQWKAEQEQKPTIRSGVKKDVDDLISRALNFSTFLEGLCKAGYTVKYGNVKHTAVKPPPAENASFARTA